MYEAKAMQKLKCFQALNSNRLASENCELEAIFAMMMYRQ